MHEVHFKAPGVQTVVIKTKDPSNVIRQAFSHDIKHGAYPRWVPFVGQENIEVEIVETRSYSLKDGRYTKV